LFYHDNSSSDFVSMRLRWIQCECFFIPHKGRCHYLCTRTS